MAYTEKDKATAKAYRAANAERLKAQRDAYRKANSEKVKAQKRESYRRHKEEIAARVAANKNADPNKRKAYRLANRDKIRARDKEYRKAHPERAKASMKKYTDANRDKLRAKCRKRSLQRTFFLRAVKEYYGCANPNCPCGKLPAYCLEYHHVTDDKAYNISAHRSRTLKELAVEMSKCVVICAICHRHLHYGDLNLSAMRRCEFKSEVIGFIQNLAMVDY